MYFSAGPNLILHLLALTQFEPSLNSTWKALALFSVGHCCYTALIHAAGVYCTLITVLRAHCFQFSLLKEGHLWGCTGVNCALSEFILYLYIYIYSLFIFIYKFQYTVCGCGC